MNGKLVNKLVLGITLTLVCQSVIAQAMYRMTDLGTFGGPSSHGTALNARGQATGYADLPGNVVHAFFWKNDGTPIVDLGTLGGTNSNGRAINNLGQVAGGASTSGDAQYDVVIWKNDGTPVLDLGNLGGTVGSTATSINDLGQVTGVSRLADQTSEHAVVWMNDGTPIKDIGTLGGPSSEGFAINNSGLVAGQSDSASNAQVAALWTNGKPISLGSLDDGGSGMAGLNDSGQVTGTSSISVAPWFHAYIWKNDGTPMQDLGDLHGFGSSAIAINKFGQVTGTSWTKGAWFLHAWLWKNDGTPMMFLGTLGGNYSASVAMNNSGQVVGNSTLKGEKISHAFLWRNDGTKMQDLNALIDPLDPLKPYVMITDANVINDASQILADGVDSRTGQTHTYFLQGTVLTLSPRSIAFGNQRIHTISTPRSVTMTNTGTKVVVITSIALKGTAAAQFSSTNNCGSSLVGHATCTITVTFKPTTKGAKSATLNVNGGSMRSVTLTGTGI